MAFDEVMQAYFRGEKLEATFFIVPIGLALLGFAGVAIKVEKPAFAWGVAVPCILFGLLATVVGLTVALRTSAQVADLSQAFASDPAAMVQRELPRMHQVMEQFDLYVKGYAVLAIVGVALRFGLKADWAHGVGPALILVAGIGFLIDGFAERRGRPYVKALEGLAAEHGVIAQRQ